MTTVSAIGAGYDRAPAAEKVLWQLQGECTHHDPELFQPVTEIAAREVKQICRRCPVVVECRAWALSHHEISGVWGAMSERDRREVWSGRRRIG